ncbi:MAG: NADH:ubiquinone reductase (Na(+)-transporting) subunit E [Chlamydiia bacterium]|nr:NADH:ubiquinone reductase (Na(+)-transporting) subunit E [Chlamydiia bacterium]
MWMGNYTTLNLLGLLIQSIFIQNILLSYFLGMCSYLACSNRVSTANGLGLAVTVVLTSAGVLNWFVYKFITGKGALAWLSFIGLDMGAIDLSFLNLIVFISVIAAFVQILEIIIERFSPPLYNALGIFLPLITVNCAILGGVLFGVTREYPLIPNLIFSLGSGLGWWLAIVLIAAIREKLHYSNIPKGLQGMGITFIMTGLMAMAFMGLLGINLAVPSKEKQPSSEEIPFKTEATPVAKGSTHSTSRSGMGRDFASFDFFAYVSF